MTQAPQIVQLPAKYWTDRAGTPIRAIIAHGTAGTDSRAYLQSGGGRRVSIQVLIRKDGTIYRMVPDERGANHAGAATSSFTLNGRTYSGGLVNRATLGFEIENLQDGRDPYTEPQLLAMGWQIAQWRAQWGNLPVLRHGDLDPTRRRDPYQLTVNQIEEWVKRATLSPVSPPKAYRVVGTPVYQRQDCKGPVALYLTPGAVVEIDKTYPEGTAHLATGAGFIRLDASVEAI